MSGTPTEEAWAGVSRLPNYRPHKMCYYRGVQRLGHAWPRLLEVRNYGADMSKKKVEG